MTAREGRRFAFTLAAAFAVIALLASWRDRDSVMRGAWLLAAALLVAGIVIPQHLGPVERAWTRFGLLLSKITSPLFLGAVYFGVFTPVGFFRRLAGKNSIEHRLVDGSYWKERKSIDPEIRRRGMERQF